MSSALPVPHQSRARATAVARTVLLILAVVDLVRGVAHTFFIHWAAEHGAGMEPHPDALVLMGAFGISNFLTAALFILIAVKAKDIAGYVLGLIPLAYLVGGLGMRLSNVTMQSEFNGQYMMRVYLAVCLVTFFYYLFASRKSAEIKKLDNDSWEKLQDASGERA